MSVSLDTIISEYALLKLLLSQSKVTLESLEIILPDQTSIIIK